MHVRLRHARVTHLDRRTFLSWISTLLASHWATARAEATQTYESLKLQELDLGGDRKLARRALLLLPAAHDGRRDLPLLVLLHGLGETHDEEAGLRAWSERYGLVSAFQRLLRPPIERTLPKSRYLEDACLDRLNSELRLQPFSGMAFVCPITPNVYQWPSTREALDRYSDWIESALLPAVRKAAGIDALRPATAIDGCSLGGYVSLEVFLRKPALFSRVGMVQGAIGVARARGYAERLAQISAEYGSLGLRLGTSTADPYRKPNEVLSKELLKRGIRHTLEVHPGPHDQPWLEVGTLSMLYWHDRQAFGAPGPALPFHVHG
jgi:pimeloyl-ACP methyl ester carboxylesterase